MNAADKLLLKSGYDLQGNSTRKNTKKRKHKSSPKVKALTKPSFDPKSPEIVQRMKSSRGIIRQRENSDLSDGEKVVAQFLSENDVKFVREQYGPKLYNPRTNKLLFFDFYLPDYKLVIEFDGFYHFKCKDGEEEKLEQQKYKDSLKNEFCRNNNIRMLRLKKIKTAGKLICEMIDRIAR